MKCLSCGSEWNVANDLACKIEKCPFCNANLQFTNNTTDEYLQLLNSISAAKVEPLIPQEFSKENDPFIYMPIDDKYYINGRGTMAYGLLKLGEINVNDQVSILFKDGSSKTSTVSGIELSGNSAVYAYEGNQVGVLLKGLSLDDLRGSIAILSTDVDLQHKKFIGYVELKYKNELQLIDQSYTSIRVLINENKGIVFEGCGYLAFLENDSKLPDMEKVSVELVENDLPMIPGIGFAVCKGDEEIAKGVVDSFIE